MTTGAEPGLPAVPEMTFDAALAVLASHAVPLGQEMIALAKAGRRMLAAPVYAAIDAPRADTAAMDGFAMRAFDVEAGRTHFRIVGASFPAAPFGRSIAMGEAVRITTGAPMPEGATCVVMSEVAAEAQDILTLAGPLSPNRNVRRRASDFARGDAILSASRILDPRALLAAGAADAGMVTVWKRPRVSVLATGDELVAPGTAADADSPYAIPDSLSEAVLLLCHQWAAKPVEHRRAPDNVDTIAREAASLLADCDVLVLVGGASRGRRDFARAALEPLSLELQFAKLAIKPGKPVWYGRVGERHVIGLPGNPTAAMTVARLLLVPLLTGLAGRGVDAGLAWSDQPLAAAAPPGTGRERFLCGATDGCAVRILERQSAGSQALLARADRLVRLAGSGPALPVGTLVPTLRF